MSLKNLCSSGTLSLLLLAGNASLASTAPVQPVAGLDATTRIVVKYRTDAHTRALSASSTNRESRATAALSRSVKGLRTMANGATIYWLETPVTAAEARVLAARIATEPDVEYALPDLRVRISQTIPADPYANVQWPLKARGQAAGGADFLGAWASSRGANVVVAVIDTGHVEHPDLASHVIRGYDFIDAQAADGLAIAGDGNGRDNDPSDPGDFCEKSGDSSSWHGLHVASLIAAVTDNGAGIAGAAPTAQVLQVRALGRCGGYMSDVADAVYWSVGGTLPGVPVNAQPAHVVNLSLGTTGAACPAYMQEAIDEALRRNVPVVAAAGNEGVNSVAAPGNCTGVVTVGAHTQSADLADYSNHASQVTLTAPGGGACRTQTTGCQTQPTVSLGNTGLTTLGSNVEASYFAGTSAATPHVAAAIALLRARDMTLTPAQVTALLKATAKPHASGSFCTLHKGQCGAGMLDAKALVEAAASPTATITPGYTGTSVEGLQAVTLTAGLANGAASSYAWRQLAGSAVTLRNASSATVSFDAPANKQTLRFEVTVTTAQGASTTAAHDVDVNNKPRITSTTLKGVAGTAFAGTVAAADDDDEPLTYLLVAGPLGMTMNGNTLQWAVPAVGAYPVVVAVSDSSGLRTVATVQVVIDAASSSGGSGDSGGKGGGSTDLWFLGIAALAALWLRLGGTSRQ